MPKTGHGAAARPNLAEIETYRKCHPVSGLGDVVPGLDPSAYSKSRDETPGLVTHFLAVRLVNDVEARDEAVLNGHDILHVIARTQVKSLKSS